MLDQTILIGRLTRDPEVKQTANGNVVCNIGLAVNRKYADGQGIKREEVCFFDVETWGNVANSVGQYCRKGKLICVVGRHRLDNWQDQDGNKRSKLKIVAQVVKFLDPAPQGQQQQQYQGQQPPPQYQGQYANDPGPPQQKPPFM